MMFSECDKYWWAQVLFVSNIYPYFEAVNEGCFYWSWPIVTDLQLILLVPLFVFMYTRKTGAWLGHLFLVSALVID